MEGEAHIAHQRRADLCRPGEHFCKEQREGWLSYALALTRNMSAAEEAMAVAAAEAYGAL